MSDATVTMVLPDGENRWYIEAIREDRSRVSLHLNIPPEGRVPAIGDVLELPDD